MANRAFDIVKMNFRSPLHLGQESNSVESIEQVCHSDTLFSAICHSWLKLYGEDELCSMLDDFWQAGIRDKEPPFYLSSAFPFATIGGNIFYYLPKPQIPPINVDLNHPRRVEIEEKLKHLKDADWISKEFFESWIVSDKEISKLDDALAKLEPHYDAIKTNSHRLDRCMKTTIRPRVALDAVSSESRIFFFGMLRFAAGSGLYFLVKWREAAQAVYEAKLKAAIHLLGDTGLGGERSSGYGAFEAEWAELMMEVPERPTNGLVTLSLWYPNEGDLERSVKLDQYMLVSRAGWTFSPALKQAYRRKIINMFAEGSTVSRGVTAGVIRSEIKGRLIDVAPENLLSDGGHRVYRYGFAFTLPVFLPRK